MYRVVYKHKGTIKQKYKEIFKRIDVQKKWEELVVQPQYSGLTRFLPHGMAASDLLTADFPVLVDVYAHFLAFAATNPPNLADVKRELSKVFNYNSARQKIATFLMDEIEKIHHHCYYCDTFDVSFYPDRNGVRHRFFKIEHVLDWGECPFVGLSLFNFVPSCDHCNTDLKGTDLIGGTIDVAKKLSPTINSYDFYNKVHFVVNALPTAITQEVDKSHIDDYEVDFDYNNGAFDPYHYIVDTFNLKERYNRGAIKAEAIRIKDLMRRNPPERIRELANQEHVTFQEKYEEIFEEEYRKRNNYMTLKMYNDLLHYKRK